MHIHPLIDPNWLSDPRDQEVAVAGYKRAREFFQTRAMKAVTIGDEYSPGAKVSNDADILKQIKTDFDTVHHAACTCRMGRQDDPSAVVDSKARVIGVEGLRAVDASSFALLPPGNPMATVCEYIIHVAGGGCIANRWQICLLRRLPARCSRVRLRGDSSIYIYIYIYI